MSDLKSNDKIYCKIDGRLAQFKKWTSTQADWDNIWLASNIEKILNKKISNLGEIECIKNFLPIEGKILEAGCGTGWIVQALSVNGYDIEGIDYAEKSIALINKIAPQLSIRLGNIFSIAVPDNYYSAYISLGVLEHNLEGPSKGLKEAFRVLQPGGISVFTVPYLNKARENLLNKLDDINDHNPSLSFYQYYFSQTEFSHYLIQAGFEIIEVVPIGLYYGLKENNAIFSYFEKHNFFHWRLRNFIYKACMSSSDFLRWGSGHMLLFICKKNNVLNNGG